MSPLTALTQATDTYTARASIDALSEAGFIIVKKDAIATAQREAVAQWLDDNKEAA